MKIAPGISLFFLSLCFEANELGELTRREGEEFDLSSGSVTTGASEIGSIFEIGHDYDFSSPLGSRTFPKEVGGVDLTYYAILDSA